MLDVEFISELMVGLMAGPLDKKTKLEEFYADYDEEFPDQDCWQERFRETRDLTAKVVDQRFSGWNSKTEYYSLFLACARLVVDGHVPGSPDLDGVIIRLMKFRQDVNQAKKRDNATPFPAYVTDYADAVARASTDLGRRLYRITVIEALLRGIDPPSGNDGGGHHLR